MSGKLRVQACIVARIAVDVLGARMSDMGVEGVKGRLTCASFRSNSSELDADGMMTLFVMLQTMSIASHPTIQLTATTQRAAGET